MPPTRAGSMSPRAPLAGLPLALSWGDFKIAHRFRAMNTAIELFAMDPRSSVHLTAAEQVFHDVEQRFSRFRDDSELSRLNARRDTRVVISREMFDLLSLALSLHAITERVFEPAVLPRIEAAGYDRSFELVARDGAATTQAEPQERRSIGDVRLEATSLTFEAPPGLRLDLGGIGKGYTVDRTAAQLAPIGDFLVNAGGDMFASGTGPGGDGWLASVANPFDFEEDLSVLHLRNEALATSTTSMRTWKRGGKILHHLIDPRTGEPAENGVVSVSVLARSAAQADVFAKTALIMGLEDGSRFLESQQTPGMFVLSDRSSASTARWPGKPPERK
jgi:thiamine biosynthesis lipoprotein